MTLLRSANVTARAENIHPGCPLARPGLKTIIRATRWPGPGLYFSPSGLPGPSFLGGPKTLRGRSTGELEQGVAVQLLADTINQLRRQPHLRSEGHTEKFVLAASMPISPLAASLSFLANDLVCGRVVVEGCSRWSARGVLVVLCPG